MTIPSCGTIYSFKTCFCYMQEYREVFFKLFKTSEFLYVENRCKSAFLKGMFKALTHPNP